MAGMSNYLETRILDHILKNTAYTPATTVYVSLHTADPTDAPSGGAFEVTGGSYARQSGTFGSAVIGGDGKGISTNTNQITYTGMPGVTVTHVGIWDAVSAGNLLLLGALTLNKTVDPGDTLLFNIGELKVTLD